jgi:hypothetical protein
MSSRRSTSATVKRTRTQSAARNCKRRSVSAEKGVSVLLPSLTPVRDYVQYRGCLHRGTDKIPSSFLVVKSTSLPPRLRLIEHLFFYRSGLPLPILADHQTRHLPTRHREQMQRRVRPRLVLGRAIFMRAFSKPSILIWATFECLRISSFILCLIFAIVLLLLLVTWRGMAGQGGKAVPWLCVRLHPLPLNRGP